MNLPVRIAKARLWLRAHGHAFWVFADQGVVSAGNFLFGIIMARQLGVEGFGHWVLLYAVVLYANTYASSMIHSPMLTVLPRTDPGSEREQMIRGTLMLQLVLAVLLGIVIVAGMTIAPSMLPQWQDVPSAWPMAMAMACFQLQDWARRCFFAQRQGKPALFSDLVTHGLQLTSILILGRLGLLDIESAFAVMAVCCLLGFGTSMTSLRMAPRWRDGVEIARMMWRTSRDYFFSWQFQWLGSQGVLFIGAGSLGVQAAGAIRAAQNLLGPTNVMFQAMENLVPVRCSVHYKNEGNVGLRRYLLKVLLLAGLPLGAVLVGVSLFSTQILKLAYGTAFIGFGYLVVLHAIYFGVSFIWRLMIFWRRTWDQAGVISFSSFVWALVALGFAALTVDVLKDRGVMWGSIAGVLVATVLLVVWPGPRGKARATSGGGNQ